MKCVLDPEFKGSVKFVECGESYAINVENKQLVKKLLPPLVILQCPSCGGHQVEKAWAEAHGFFTSRP